MSNSDKWAGPRLGGGTARPVYPCALSDSDKYPSPGFRLRCRIRTNGPASRNLSGAGGGFTGSKTKPRLRRAGRHAFPRGAPEALLPPQRR
jgi:hypothetical protein